MELSRSWRVQHWDQAPENFGNCTYIFGVNAPGKIGSQSALTRKSDSKTPLYEKYSLL